MGVDLTNMHIDLKCAICAFLGIMIWWILNEANFDYHTSPGPKTLNDRFVTKLVDEGNKCVCMCGVVYLVSLERPPLWLE